VGRPGIGRHDRPAAGAARVSEAGRRTVLRNHLLADPLLHREPAREQPHLPGQLGQAQDVLVRDVLQSGTDLNPVWREMNEFSPGGYRFAVLEDGPVRWRMRVTRRRAAG
jgi:hypothetical protein